MSFSFGLLELFKLTRLQADLVLEKLELHLVKAGLVRCFRDNHIEACLSVACREEASNFGVAVQALPLLLLLILLR